MNYGTSQSQSSVGHVRTQFVPSHPSTSQRDQYQSQCAKEARIWVKVKDRAHEPRLQGPRGVFHHHTTD